MNNVDKICNKNLWENGVKENQLECCKKRLKKLLQKNPPNLVQNFKRSLKYTSKSTWTTHNKRTQQILVEAFEANQERDLSKNWEFAGTFDKYENKYTTYVPEVGAHWFT